MYIEIGDRYVITSNRWAYKLCIKAVVMGEDTLIPISQDISLVYIVQDCLRQQLSDEDITSLEQLRDTLIANQEKIEDAFKQYTINRQSARVQKELAKYGR